MSLYKTLVSTSVSKSCIFTSLKDTHTPHLILDESFGFIFQAKKVYLRLDEIIFPHHHHHQQLTIFLKD
jgi:hypothetical protein